MGDWGGTTPRVAFCYLYTKYSFILGVYISN